MKKTIEGLRDHVRTTNARFECLQRLGVRTHPIPFFGDIATARVLTVGANPSADEFVGGRWPAQLGDEELVERLVTYFEGDPHPWFRPWSTALDLLGVGYTTGAAHLDLSPRATVAFQTFRSDPDRTRRDLFLDMVRLDLPWFARILGHCHQVRLVLLAGGVANIYMDDFLRRHLGPQPTRLVFPSGTRKGGPAPVTWPSFASPARQTPAFFCGVSPSAGTRAGQLVERVRENATRLRKLADGA